MFKIRLRFVIIIIFVLTKCIHFIHKLAKLHINNINGIVSFFLIESNSKTQRKQWFISWELTEISTKKETYHIKSRHNEQKVGCLKNMAMNLWPFTWCTRRRMAPLRLLSMPSLFSLNTLSLGVASAAAEGHTDI